MRLTSAVSFFFILLQLLPNALGLFKLTNMHCESFNKSLAVFKQCRLRAINRDTTVLNLNVVLPTPMNRIKMNGQCWRKYVGGYKPFIVNYTIDCCEYLKRRNNPIANIVYPLFKSFSNINHSCPYEGEIMLKGFYLRQELLKLPLPAGDYVLYKTWYFNDVKAMVTDAYFTFSNE